LEHDVKEQKRKLRELIWKEMETKGIARFPLPCVGRIPNYDGSEKAAERVRLLEEWKNARVIVANPDFAQQRVRENALKDGKLLIMASPKLKCGYILVDPKKVRGREEFASTIRGAFKFGVEAKDFPKPDLIVTGCVAVDKAGRRLGKGHAYGDQEIRMMKQRFGEMPVITTVHDVQIVDSVPFEEHDERVTVIVTPTKTINVKS